MSTEKILEAINNQNVAWEVFKKANDERLARIEARAGGTGEIEEKLAKINDTIDRNEVTIANLEAHAAKNATPNMGTKTSKEHSEALRAYITTGNDAALRAIVNVVKTGTDPDGGFGVPQELDAEVDKLLRETGAMMNLCRIKTVGAGYSKLVNVLGVAVANTKELEIIANTATSKLAKVSPVWGKMEAKPLLSQEAIEDIFFNAEAWIREDVFEQMDETLELELLQGAGALGATKGLLSYGMSTDIDGVRAFGELQYRKTGVAGGFKVTSATVNPADDLIDLTTDLKEKFQQNSVFLMNRKTKGAVRKFKDNDGAYIWQPRMSEAEPERILGFGVRTSHGMPIVADGSNAIAFGDFDKSVSICLRPGLYVIRDQYSKKPNIEFIFVKRYGLMLRNSEGIKILRTAA